jgi:acyl-CoA synthetase (AMP-forming)/AMP-acid ligase II
VLEVSIIGRKHDGWGEEVVAYVVSRDGANIDKSELDQICLDHIARFKRPKKYIFIEALPKNNYGKVLKTELRSRQARRKARAAGRCGRRLATVA